MWIEGARECLEGLCIDNRSYAGSAVGFVEIVELT
jgi:hypothetical protein